MIITIQSVKFNSKNIIVFFKNQLNLNNQIENNVFEILKGVLSYRKVYIFLKINKKFF